MKGVILLLILILIGVFLFKSDSLNRQKLSNYSQQDSELALLMRYIHDQAKLMRSNIVNEESFLDYNDEIEFIIDANPTRPAVQGPEFEAFARYFIKTNSEVFNDPQKASYNTMVDACVACHKGFCPGPIRTIKKLNIK